MPLALKKVMKLVTEKCLGKKCTGCKHIIILYTVLCTIVYIHIYIYIYNIL